MTGDSSTCGVHVATSNKDEVEASAPRHTVVNPCQNRNRTTMKCRRVCCRKVKQEIVSPGVQTFLKMPKSYEDQKHWFWNTRYRK